MPEETQGVEPSPTHRRRFHLDGAAFEEGESEVDDSEGGAWSFV